MTLDEAIKHCEEKAEEQRRWATSLENESIERVACIECAKEHEQLAEWLKDYKRLLTERPTGEWIEKYDPTDGFCYLVCSNCKDDNSCSKTNFCPNCGADMRKGGAE